MRKLYNTDIRSGSHVASQGLSCCTPSRPVVPSHPGGRGPLWLLCIWRGCGQKSILSLRRYTVTPILYRERQDTTALPLTFRILEPLRLAFVYEVWHMLCGVLEELGQLVGPARLEAAYELLVQVCGRASPGPSALRHKPRAVLYQPVAWVEATEGTEDTARLFLEVV